jgi:hypothetical protein
MARPRLGNAVVLHAHLPGTLKRSVDIDRLFRSLALPTGGPCVIGISTRIALPDPAEEAQAFLRDAQILCKMPAWFLNRQVNGNLCMIVTEN